jgi:hypothetical protein
MNKTSFGIIGALILAFAIYAFITEKKLSDAISEGSFYKRESESRKDSIMNLKNFLQDIASTGDSLKVEHKKITTDEEIKSDPAFQLLDSSASWQDIRSTIAGPTGSD